MSWINISKSWVWHHSKDVKYSVKSGYYVASNHPHNDHHGMDDVDWKCLWKVLVPPKLNTLLGS